MTQSTGTVPSLARGTKLPPGGDPTQRHLPAISEDDNGVSWGDPTRTGTAYDFRTDAITTPSLSHLTAIHHATLNDDVFGEDASTARLERHMASVCGREAAAFVVSCTMANQLALAALCASHALPGSCGVLADASAHVVRHEAGGLATLARASVQAVAPRNGVYLTAGDLEVHATVVSDEGEEEEGGGEKEQARGTWTVCPTRVVSVEDTAHGNVVPLTELQAIRAWTARRGVKVHIDGARVWEAVAASTPRAAREAGTLAEIAACADAITLSFAKGLGAPIGAVVVGSAALIRRVKRLRQSIGGGVRKMGVLAAAASQAVLDNFGPGNVDVRGVLGTAHGMAAAVARMWTDRGGRLLRRTDTNMVWLDLGSAGVTAEGLNELGMHHSILVAAPRIVLHYQISTKALASLDQVFEAVLIHRQLEPAVKLDRVSRLSKGCTL